MYELYEKYNNYQKEIYLDQKRWSEGGTPEKMLENLQEIQDFLMPFSETFAFPNHHHSSLLPKSWARAKNHSSLICAMNDTRTSVLCQG